jgi:hypothetical protein
MNFKPENRTRIFNSIYLKQNFLNYQLFSSLYHSLENMIVKLKANRGFVRKKIREDFVEFQHLYLVEIVE